ncbi:HD domain-containing protein [Anaerosalibacter massiliensis]|uniref:HD domain-containing protein n=1 Tax=Anaerosalibacter massiliensis TaxID=1347392 RepID=A0A9X2MKE9_9FIRM|nr:HD domain-containing protein [Anaerosalibacter massiliensis]MCR2045229.1 HD domain-containing protein [Anaerosalibacter massiliensis]
MNNDRDLAKEIKFIIELDKMKSIFRETSLINKSKRENDAEHSWHIAVMSMILSDYADEDINVHKVMKMLLVHDLVEIYAGDTFCYDEIGNMDKTKREKEAADKLFSMLPKDKEKEIRKLWDEFEEMETEESLFANCMDRFQPFLMNYYSGGGTWKKYNISKEQVLKRGEPIKKSSKKLWDFVESLIEDSVEKGYIKKL